MTTQQKLIKSKMGLLDLASYLHNVSEACRVMGYSRDTFYRVKKAYEQGGEEALIEQTRRKPCIKNRVPEEVEKAVLDLALDDPSQGQKRASDTLRQEGVFISPGGVRSVWLRHGLETFKKRLSALEKVVAETGKVLTEGQLKALEKAKEEKTAKGEIETEHVGYLGSQDTYYVGAIKGVGRIYQQTFIDTMRRWALPSCTPPSIPSIRPTCSMTGCFPSLSSMRSRCTAHLDRPGHRVLRQAGQA
jgi:transposase